MFTDRISTTERIFNIIELLGIVLMLFLAFVFQVILNELPCPLCLLQRIGFLGVAFGFLLNLRFGLRPSHYAIVLMSALYTSFVALRQVALHVVPGTGVYGNAVFGLHLYTWCFVVAMIVVVFTTLMLGVDRQYRRASSNNIRWRYLTHFLFIIVALMAMANLVSVILECGIQQCPDNPVSYKLLMKNKGIFMKKEIVEIAAPIELIGLKERTSFKNESDPTKAIIGKLVGQFWQQNVPAKIPNQLQPDVTLAVYSNYESNEYGAYDYFYGKKVSSINNVPTGLTSIIIPSGKYVKLTTKAGPIPDILMHGWQQIWKMSAADLGGQRTYKTDFEVYDERARDRQNAIIDIYLGIK